MQDLLFVCKFFKNVTITKFCYKRFTFFILILFCSSNQVLGKYTFVVRIKEVNIKNQSSAISPVIGKLYYGDTVNLKYISGDWVGIKLNNGKTGFIYKTYLRQVELPVYQTDIKTGHNADFNSSSLFSATIKYFLIISGFIFFILLLIYYLR